MNTVIADEICSSNITKSFFAEIHFVKFELIAFINFGDELINHLHFTF